MTYTYRGLGQNGRLGNQMFQYSTLFALAKMNNASFAIPEKVTRYDFYLDGRYELLDAFPNLSADILPVDDDVFKFQRQYVEPTFAFDPNIFLITGDLDLHGYFQSGHYFADFKEDIKREFAFTSEVQSNCRLFIEKIRKENPGSNICSLHVRRSDYQAKSDYHTMLSTDTDYYTMGIHAILSRFPLTKFVIFSDDVGWCRQAFPQEAVFPDMNSQYEDMCLMTMCDTHIIANSSFSWWGAWLSDSKFIIAPKAWFGPKGPPDWSSIYCKGWNIA